MTEYFISGNPELLDREFIVRSLQSTYWAVSVHVTIFSSLLRGRFVSGLMSWDRVNRSVSHGSLRTR